MRYDIEVMKSFCTRPGYVAMRQDAKDLMAMAKKQSAKMERQPKLGSVHECPRDRDECEARIVMGIRTMRRLPSGRGAQNARSNWDAIMRAAIFSLKWPAGFDEDAKLMADASRTPLDEEADEAGLDYKLARAFNPSQRDVGDWLEATQWWSSLGTHPGETLIPGSPIGKNVSRGMALLWLDALHDPPTDRIIADECSVSPPTIRNWRALALDRAFAIAKTRYAERARAKR